MNLRASLIISVAAFSLPAVLAGQAARADNPPTLDWLRQYVVPRYAVFDNVTAQDGDIFVSGRQANSTNTAVSLDVLLKYDFSGTLLSTTEVGTSSRYDYVNELASDDAGNLYLAGITSGIIGGPNQDNYDAYLRKITTTGSALWSRQLGGTSVDQFHGVSLDGLGNLYVAGVGKGNLFGPSQGQSDALLGKYDAAGNLAWSRQYGGSQDDYASAVAADPLGNVFVAGVTRSNLAGAAGGSELFLAKYDESGNQQWLQQYGSPSDDDVRRLVADGLGNVYALERLNQGEAQSYRVSKYASDGSSLWSRIIGTDSSVLSASALSIDAAGNVYVGGGTKLNSAGENDGDLDAFVSKYSPNGETLWMYQLGTNIGSEWVFDVFADEQGRIVVVGETNGSFTLPVQNYAVAAWIAMLSAPVPEPSSAALASIAVAAIGGQRTMRRRSKHFQQR
jgi:hypothetical protein